MYNFHKNDKLCEITYIVKQDFDRIISESIDEPILLNMINILKKNFSDDYRTGLTSLACESVGGDSKNVIPYCTIISLISASFGIHDDIIDNSVNKQFKTTLFGRFGQNNSLVLGDYLLLKVISIVNQLVNKKNSNAIKILDTIQNLYSTMIQGELMEINLRKNLETDLDYIHKMMWKISIDGEACTKIGALAGNGNKNEINILSHYGKQLGYLWRLYSEVEDTLNFNAKLPSRLKYESIPLPVVYATKQSQTAYNTMNSIIQRDDISTNDFHTILDLCYENGSFDYVRQIAEKVYTHMINELSDLKKTQAREDLYIMASNSYEKIIGYCGEF